MNDTQFDEELNLKLYNKLLWEFERYKEKLLTMSPEEILKHAYKYVMYEEMVCICEYTEFNTERVKALLKSPTPLEDIFSKWEHSDYSYMDVMQDIIELTADDKIEKSKKRNSRNKYAKER